MNIIPNNQIQKIKDNNLQKWDVVAKYCYYAGQISWEEIENHPYDLTDQTRSIGKKIFIE